MLIKNFINIDYPRCPLQVILPTSYVNTERDKEAYYVIVPNRYRYNRYDFPFIRANVSDRFLFPDNRPVYHKGFILMQGKHNGLSPKEIDVSIFDYMNKDDNSEYMTLRKIMNIVLSNINHPQNIQSLVNVCNKCPDMLDLALENDFDLIWNKNKPRVSDITDGSLVLRGYDYLRSFLDINYEFILPKAYIINLPSRTDRLERITSRLNKYKIQYSVVEAYDKDCEFVSRMSLCADHINCGRVYNRDAQFACLYSHLKAIETFYDSGDSMAFIFEDDCTFRKDFGRLIKPIVYKLSTMIKFNLCSLLVSNEPFYREVNNTPQNTPEHIELAKLDDRAWGMVGYIISRDYAKECLDRFKKPILECPSIPKFNNYVTSEIIPMYSDGWATTAPLVMDELGPSNVCEQNPIIHRNMFAFHNFDNFDIPSL